MCRNIKTLFNFDPPATDDEINAAALQFVRKISGFRSPSRANETAFNEAIEQISLSGRHLLQRLTTTSPARDREVEAARARAAVRVDSVALLAQLGDPQSRFEGSVLCTIIVSRPGFRAAKACRERSPLPLGG